MNISKIDQCRIRDYNLEQRKLQDKRDEDYRKVVEKQRFERIVAERVSRNLRLDLDKGRKIDVEC
jgi:DNA topoisomerase VI subunit A